MCQGFAQIVLGTFVLQKLGASAFVLLGVLSVDKAVSSSTRNGSIRVA